jgi:hypothetical protein
MQEKEYPCRYCGFYAVLNRNGYCCEFCEWNHQSTIYSSYNLTKGIK